MNTAWFISLKKRPIAKITVFIGVFIIFLIFVFRTFTHIVWLPIGIVSPAWPSPGSEQMVSIVILEEHPFVWSNIDMINWEEERNNAEISQSKEFTFKVYFTSNSVPHEIGLKIHRLAAFYRGSSCFGMAQIVSVNQNDSIEFSAEEEERESFTMELNNLTKKESINTLSAFDEKP